MKHGFLIMIHNNYDQVSKLLNVLDCKSSYFFIHVDKKSVISKKEEMQFRSCVKKGKIFFANRVAVQWGDYSLIEAELNLLSLAVEYELDYLHLISGADLPIKNWNTIDEFFEKNAGNQFVSFVPMDYQISLQKRIKYYWIFQEKIGNPKLAIRNKQIGKIFLLILQRLFVLIQKIIHVDRRKKNSDIQFVIASEWFSITNSFAQEIVSKRAWIEKTFKNTLCGDEIFLSTLLFNSKYKEAILPNARYIDWGRGNPYVFRMSDLEDLLSNEGVFARKFDESIDEEIIDAICESINK